MFMHVHPNVIGKIKTQIKYHHLIGPNPFLSFKQNEKIKNFIQKKIMTNTFTKDISSEIIPQK